MTEDELVAAIAALAAAPSRAIVLGIGDDAAAWRPSRSHLSVISTDALVENVHFTREHFDAPAIGHRALASNFSDIAAMGALPRVATVAFGIPSDATTDYVLEIYAGIAALARRFQTAIVGGDLTRSREIFVSITVVGEVRPSNLKLRAGGRPGDVIAVTGSLGTSGAGYHLLRQPSLIEDSAVRAVAIDAHRVPEPRVREGRWLGASSAVHAMIDCSDGISTDLARLAAASGCGASIESVPIADAALAVASARGEDVVRSVLGAGEDFELILAVAARAFPRLQRAFARRFGRPLHMIGKLRAQPGLALRNESGELPIEPSGWDHLGR